MIAPLPPNMGFVPRPPARRSWRYPSATAPRPGFTNAWSVRFARSSMSYPTKSSSNPTGPKVDPDQGRASLGPAQQPGLRLRAPPGHPVRSGRTAPRLPLVPGCTVSHRFRPGTGSRPVSLQRSRQWLQCPSRPESQACCRRRRTGRSRPGFRLHRRWRPRSGLLPGPRIRRA